MITKSDPPLIWADSEKAKKTQTDKQNTLYGSQRLLVICRCLPPDRIWHKVNDYSGDLGEGDGQAWVEAWTLLVYAGHQPS